MKKPPLILLVEDDQFLLELLKSRLEKEGFAVELAQDGKEAVLKLREADPDLMLLDLCLPRESGFDSMEEMKEIKKAHDVPIIVISNLDSIEDIQRAKDLGAHDYLVKSKTPQDTIIQKIRELLDDEEEE